VSGKKERHYFGKYFCWQQKYGNLEIKKGSWQSLGLGGKKYIYWKRSFGVGITKFWDLIMLIGLGAKFSLLMYFRKFHFFHISQTILPQNDGEINESQRIISSTETRCGQVFAKFGILVCFAVVNNCGHFNRFIGSAWFCRGKFRCYPSTNAIAAVSSFVCIHCW